MNDLDAKVKTTFEIKHLHSFTENPKSQPNYEWVPRIVAEEQIHLTQIKLQISQEMTTKIREKYQAKIEQFRKLLFEEWWTKASLQEDFIKLFGDKKT